MHFGVQTACLLSQSQDDRQLSKIFVNMDKTDPLDAYIIADFARVGRIFL
ncbi:hypothetical protein [uncultured Acetobacterium sp.]|nr:hypothetical protein [uncultured Acetobacterium sp.]